MTDRIDFGGEPWKAIPRSTLRDQRLSPRALGGLVTLLSHDEGWVRSCIALLMAEKNCGRKQAQAIMAELRTTGYAELIHERSAESNLLHTRYTVYAVSQSATSQPDLSTAPTYREPSRPETVPPGLGSAVVEPLDVEPLEEEPQALILATTTSSRPINPVWDVLVELYGNPTATGRGAMNTAEKVLRDAQADPDQIRRVVLTLRPTDTRWSVQTPTALAKWWGQREQLLAQVGTNHVDRTLEQAEELRSQGL